MVDFEACLVVVFDLVVGKSSMWVCLLELLVTAITDVELQIL